MFFNDFLILSRLGFGSSLFRILFSLLFRLNYRFCLFGLGLRFYFWLGSFLLSFGRLLGLRLFGRRLFVTTSGFCLVNERLLKFCKLLNISKRKIIIVDITILMHHYLVSTYYYQNSKRTHDNRPEYTTILRITKRINNMYKRYLISSSWSHLKRKYLYEIQKNSTNNSTH